MSIALNPEKRYIGKLCGKHPELGGIRLVSNATCIQCDRDTSRKWRDAKRLAAGKAIKVVYSKEEAAQRIRDRNRIRSAERRKNKAYREKQIERKRAWREANRDHVRKVNRAYDAKMLRENLQRKISKNLRTRLYKAVMGHVRGASAVRDLGMSIPEFRDYIASKFSPGMSWENYGKWHLDHIRPLISFNLTNREEQLEAIHYTNYQPLWAVDNIRKHGKIHPATWPRFYAQAWGAV